LFGLSYSISLFAIVAGVLVKKSGNYTIPTYFGWELTVLGAGLLTTLHADSSMAKSIGFQLVIGSGVGIIYVISMFPILASIPVTQSGPAMALHVFSRNLGYVSPSISITFPPSTYWQLSNARSGVSRSAVPFCRMS
jgi:hypothetical protein